MGKAFACLVGILFCIQLSGQYIQYPELFVIREESPRTLPGKLNGNPRSVLIEHWFHDPLMTKKNRLVRADRSDTVCWDRDGKIISSNVTLPHGEDCGMYLYIYSPEGRLVRIEDEAEQAILDFVYEGERLHRIEGVFTREFSGSAGNKVVKEYVEEREPLLWSLMVDENGRVVRMECYIDKESSQQVSPVSDKVFERDENGFITSVSTRYPESGNGSHVFTYVNDRYGNPVKSTLEWLESMSSKTSTTYNYKYDEYGNWTVREVFFMGKLSSRTTRSIGYYDSNRCL